MLYEIIAITFLFLNLIFFLANPSKEIREELSKYKDITKESKNNPGLFFKGLFYVVCSLIWFIITFFMMLWVGQVIVYAKYYVIGLLGYIVLTLIISSLFKTKNIKKETPLYVNFVRYLTVICESVFIIWSFCI